MLPLFNICIVEASKMLIKAIIILFLLFIFFTLGSALFYLVRDKGHSNRVVKALTWRIGISIALFILLMVAFAFGWLTPHSI